VGYKLLDGPKTIHSSSGDSHPYLESMICIRWHSETFGEWRSVRIYCDANGTDEDGYIDPMVRFARWDRTKDIVVLRPSWPSVLIDLATLPIDSLELQAAVHKLQEVVGQVPFVAHGLPTRRNFGEYAGPLPIRLAPHVPQASQPERLPALEINPHRDLRLPSFRHS